MEMFGFIFLLGIPLLLLWSLILTLVEVKRADSEGQFLGRTLTFIGGIYHYAISSFAAWIGLIALHSESQPGKGVHFRSIIFWFIWCFYGL